MADDDGIPQRAINNLEQRLQDLSEKLRQALAANSSQLQQHISDQEKWSAQNKAVEEKCSSLQKENEVLRRLRADVDSTVIKLQSMMESAQIEKMEMSRLMELQKQETTLGQLQIDSLNEALKEKSKELRSFEQRLGEAVAGKQQVDAELNSLRNRNSALLEEQAELRNKIKLQLNTQQELNNLLNEMRGVLVESQTKMADEASEVERLRDLLTSAQESHAAELSHLRESHETEIAGWRQKTEDMKSSHAAALSQKQREVDDKRSELQRLSLQVLQINDEKSEIANELKVLRSASFETQTSWKTERGTLVSSLEEAREAAAQLSQQCEQSEARLKSWAAESKAQQQMNADCIQALSEEKAKLSTEVAALRGTIDSAAAVHEEAASRLRTERTELLEKLRAHRQRIQLLEEKNEEESAKSEAQLAELREMKEQNSLLLLQLKRQAELQQQQQQHEKTVDVSALESLKLENAAELENQRRSFEKKISQMVEEREGLLEEASHEWNQQLQQQERILQRMRDDHSKLAALWKEEKSDLASRQLQLVAEKDELHLRLQELDREVLHWKNLVTDGKKREVAAERSYAKELGRLDDAIRDHLEQIEQLNSKTRHEQTTNEMLSKDMLALKARQLTDAQAIEELSDALTLLRESLKSSEGESRDLQRQIKLLEQRRQSDEDAHASEVSRLTKRCQVLTDTMRRLADQAPTSSIRDDDGMKFNNLSFPAVSAVPVSTAARPSPTTPVSSGRNREEIEDDMQPARCSVELVETAPDSLGRIDRTSEIDFEELAWLAGADGHRFSRPVPVTRALRGQSAPASSMPRSLTSSQEKEEFFPDDDVLQGSVTTKADWNAVGASPMRTSNNSRPFPSPRGISPAKSLYPTLRSTREVAEDLQVGNGSATKQAVHRIRSAPTVRSELSGNAGDMFLAGNEREGREEDRADYLESDQLNATELKPKYSPSETATAISRFQSAINQRKGLISSRGPRRPVIVPTWMRTIDPATPNDRPLPDGTHSHASNGNSNSSSANGHLLQTPPRASLRKSGGNFGDIGSDENGTNSSYAVRLRSSVEKGEAENAIPFSPLPKLKLPSPRG